jgi:hypothetical protein
MKVVAVLNMADVCTDVTSSDVTVVVVDENLSCVLDVFARLVAFTVITKRSVYV